MGDVLVIASKVKRYIKEHGDCNTSNDSIRILSQAVESLCKKGIDRAKAESRKTVMARDINIDHI